MVDHLRKGNPPLAASEFNGDKATVARLLHHLGFTVQVGDSNDLLAEIRPSERLGNSPAETTFAALAHGEDRPAQMIALCPDCHAIESRGSTRHDAKMVLINEAERRHDEPSES
jgi:hypothetical protein